MKRTVRFLALAAPAALMLAACTPPNSGNLVDAGQAQRAQTVNFGTVVSVQSVNVQGGNNVANVTGTIAGGVIGAALGREVGGGLGREPEEPAQDDGQHEERSGSQGLHGALRLGAARKARCVRGRVSRW